MLSRRKFLQLTGATIVSLANNSIPTDLFQKSPGHFDEGIREETLYESNLDVLYQKRALALLNNDKVAFDNLDVLVTLLEDKLNSNYEFVSNKEYLVQIAVEHARKFREKTVSNERVKRLMFDVVVPRLKNLRSILKESTKFNITRLANNPQMFLRTYDFFMPLPDHYLRILQEYEIQAKKLIKSKYSKKDKSTIRIANTIYNSAPYSKSIYKASSEENQPINALISIVSIESIGIPYVPGRAGEVGMFQIKPKTAKDIWMSYSNRFSFSSEDDMFEKLIRDQSLNAIFATLVLKDASRLSYPEKVAAYKDGIGNVANMSPEELKNHYYVRMFERLHDTLERKAYLG